MKVSVLPNSETGIVQAPGQLSNEIDGETILLSIENGKYYGLNPVASRIWELIAQPIKIADLIARIREEYNVSIEICETELREYLESLLASGLAVVSK